MKISIITVCYNSDKTLEKTIQSVLSQKYNNLEYIIIDGNSNDNSVNIVNKYINRIDYFITEPDNGIYDAINKGIIQASGDIIGILNSDDEYSNNEILSTVALKFKENSNLDSLFGDVIFINKNGKKIRNYSAKSWNNSKFSWGFMPPHPSFYCKKYIFEKYGYYKTFYKIASDFDLLLRFLKSKNITYKYLPLTMVVMKMGGVSTRGIKSIYTINKEIFKICKLHGIKTNYFKLYLKYFYKIFEFFKN